MIETINKILLDLICTLNEETDITDLNRFVMYNTNGEVKYIYGYDDNRSKYKYKMEVKDLSEYILRDQPDKKLYFGPLKTTLTHLKNNYEYKLPHDMSIDICGDYVAINISLEDLQCNVDDDYIDDISQEIDNTFTHIQYKDELVKARSITNTDEEPSVKDIIQTALAMRNVIVQAIDKAHETGIVTILDSILLTGDTKIEEVGVWKPTGEEKRFECTETIQIKLLQPTIDMIVTELGKRKPRTPLQKEIIDTLIFRVGAGGVRIKFKHASINIKSFSLKSTLQACIIEIFNTAITGIEGSTTDYYEHLARTTLSLASKAVQHCGAVTGRIKWAPWEEYAQQDSKMTQEIYKKQKEKQMETFIAQTVAKVKSLDKKTVTRVAIVILVLIILGKYKEAKNLGKQIKTNITNSESYKEIVKDTQSIISNAKKLTNTGGKKKNV